MADSLVQISEKLQVPFPRESHKQRQAGGGKSLTYVEGHTVIHRLIDATGNQFDVSVDKIERTQLDANNTLLMAYVTLTIPGLGSRSHIGVQSVNARGGEDLVKGAVTDALKKAATLFGVGLELYGPDYEAGEIQSAPQTHQDGSGATLPPRPVNHGQNVVPNGNGAAPQARAGLPPTERQFGMVGAQMKRLGWSNDDIHGFAGVESLNDLDRAQVSSLIDTLMKMEPGTAPF